MVFIRESIRPPPPPHLPSILADSPGGRADKPEYWFSIFEGTKTCRLLELGATPELAINRVSSFQFL